MGGSRLGGIILVCSSALFMISMGCVSTPNTTAGDRESQQIDEGAYEVFRTRVLEIVSVAFVVVDERNGEYTQFWFTKETPPLKLAVGESMKMRKLARFSAPTDFTSATARAYLEDELHIDLSKYPNEAIVIETISTPSEERRKGGEVTMTRPPAVRRAR